MQTKRIFFTVLAALMLLTALIACGATPSPSAETTAPLVSTTAAPVTTAAPETTSDPDLSHIPEDLRFDNQIMRFLDVNESGPHGSYWATYDIWAENINGDVINDAVFKRNLWVEERFGVKIIENKVNDVVATITLSVNAQTDEYDAMLGTLSQVSNLTTKRYLRDLTSDLPYLDLSKSWWDQNQAAGMSVGHKVYYATGDLTVVDNDATFALMFNKQMAKDHQLGDLYASVNEGKWTMEQMSALMTKVAGDVNGDGKLDWQTDRYGISTGNIAIEALFYGAGLVQTKKDQDDLPSLALDIEKTAAFIEKAYPLAADPDLCFNYSIEGRSADNCKEVFTAGRALFYGETLQGVTRLRDSDVDFGILPFPKWDEAQSQYYSFQHSVGSAIAVPISNQHPEKTGAVLEAMAAISQEYLTPAYYDVLLIGRGLRDVESEPMVELILANRVYDSGYVYDWGKLINSIRTMVQNNRPGIASAMKATEKLFNNNLAKTLEAINADT